MFNDRYCDKTHVSHYFHTDPVSAGVVLHLNWRRWIQPRPPQMLDISGRATPRYHEATPRYTKAVDGFVRLYADCVRAKFDGENRLISVTCPAVLCGSVPVSDNWIGEHRAWDAQPCRWVRTMIIDDTVPAARAIS